MTDYVEITIKKPLYEFEGENFVYIWDKYIKKAKKENKLLRITTPAGDHYTTWKDWIKNGKKIKKVFKFENRPMHLTGNYAIPNQPPKEEEINMDNYLKNMLKLKKIAKKKGII